MKRPTREHLVAALESIGLCVVDVRNVSADSRVGLPRSVNVTFKLPDRSATSSIVDTGNGILVDPSNKDLRRFLSRICRTHGFSPFDIDDPAFGWAAVDRKHGTVYTLSVPISAELVPV
jgi:hypothetical protein